MSPINRTLYIFLISIPISLICVYFFGIIGFIILFASIILALLLQIGSYFRKRIIKSWEEYGREKEYEAQQIVNRLGGVR